MRTFKTFLHREVREEPKRLYVFTLSAKTKSLINDKNSFQLKPPVSGNISTERSILSVIPTDMIPDSKKIAKIRLQAKDSLGQNFFEGGYQVKIFDTMYFGNSFLEQNRNLKIVQGDIRDTEKLKNECKGFDYFIHLAFLNISSIFSLIKTCGLFTSFPDPTFPSANSGYTFSHS